MRIYASKRQLKYIQDKPEILSLKNTVLNIITLNVQAIPIVREIIEHL